VEAADGEARTGRGDASERSQEKEKAEGKRMSGSEGGETRGADKVHGSGQGENLEAVEDVRGTQDGRSGNEDWASVAPFKTDKTRQTAT